MSEVVRSYYDREVEREWGRLDRPYRRLELVTTLHLIGQHFPTSGHLADIGGGPGRYTVELLRRGFRVTLVDLSPRAVAFAQALAELEAMAGTDPVAYANVLRLAEETCELPQYRDATEHLHVVVRKLSP
ncbi:methyltransferase domain-containing protein [Candidatus Bipolaricaulota bacterium]|nr:methyltransferase domain-containing protein [Candidatus Bipolaricaulota bacterium]